MQCKSGSRSGKAALIGEITDNGRPAADGISKHWRGEIRNWPISRKKRQKKSIKGYPVTESVASLVRLVKENAERIFEGIGSLQKTGDPFQNIDDRVNEKIRHRRCRKWPQ
ncbi:hypothetical protein [Cohnella laeviribosi]|uniref:hypothetical protein n=1 Tax=Cohnella laeviribosi TaxID=380174 RepID=UPI0003612DE3|nr:hypothetical protein [Cohnella laeviribosi]